LRFEAGGLPCGDDERGWQYARDVVLTAVFGSAPLNPGRRCLQVRRRRTPQQSQAITQYPASLRVTEPKDIFLAVTPIGQVAEPAGRSLPRFGLRPPEHFTPGMVFLRLAREAGAAHQLVSRLNCRRFRADRLKTHAPQNALEFYFPYPLDLRLQRPFQDRFRDHRGLLGLIESVKATQQE